MNFNIFIKPNTDLSSAKVYRMVASGSNNKLAMLIGVVSKDCDKTINHYLQHASVEVIEAPVHLPNAKPTMSGIDLIIKEKKTAPYYEIANRLKQSFLEHLLVEETKLRQ